MSSPVGILTADDAWKDILVVLHDIQDRAEKKKLPTMNDFLKGYNVVHTASTQKIPFNFAAQTYENSVRHYRDYLSFHVMSKFYNVKDSQLLAVFIDAYEVHKIFSKWFGKVFSYLDRYYVNYQQLDHYHEFLPADFKKYVYNSLKSKLVTSLFQLLRPYCEGRENSRPMKKHQLRKAVQYLVEIDPSIQDAIIAGLFRRTMADRLETELLRYRAASEPNTSPQVFYKEVLLREMKWMVEVFPLEDPRVWKEFHGVVLEIVPRELVVPVVPVSSAVEGSLLVQWYLDK